MFSNEAALKMYLGGGGRSPRWPPLEVAHIKMDPTRFWCKFDESGVLCELLLSRDRGKTRDVHTTVARRLRARVSVVRA